MYIYTPLCRYWIALYRYVLVFIVPHMDIELEDNKQFILNIPRTVDSRYLEIQGTVWNTSRNPYLDRFAELRKKIVRATTFNKYIYI